MSLAAAKKEVSFERILGVRFINASPSEALEFLEERGGYLVVPAAPALANIQRDPDYRKALLNADLAIGDSGFMTLLWLFLKGRKVRRISGLNYLQVFLRERRSLVAEDTLLVLPSEAARARTLHWFRAQSIPVSPESTYVAPKYDFAVADNELLARIESDRPRHIVIAIGGGAQEKLAYYLREQLSYRPCIHCIGAALGFLTGDQKAIPRWVDRMYLGWLLRLLREPRRFSRRFLSAFELPGLILRYGSELPPLLQTPASTNR